MCIYCSIVGVYLHVYTCLWGETERFHDYGIQEEKVNIEIAWFATENSAQPDPGGHPVV